MPIIYANSDSGVVYPLRISKAAGATLNFNFLTDNAVDDVSGDDWQLDIIDSSGNVAASLQPGGEVASATVTAGGSGYTSVPTVAFSGGAGTGAAATAVLTSEVVTSLVITDPGSGYTSAPTIAFSGGAGSGAAATAVLSDGAMTVAGASIVVAITTADLSAVDAGAYTWELKDTTASRTRIQGDCVITA
ncbi:MAG: hypothetical protein ACREHG_06695 [Candidatus Saccharimonadales bacterium]